MCAWIKLKFVFQYMIYGLARYQSLIDDKQIFCIDASINTLCSMHCPYVVVYIMYNIYCTNIYTHVHTEFASNMVDIYLLI